MSAMEANEYSQIGDATKLAIRRQRHALRKESQRAPTHAYIGINQLKGLRYTTSYCCAPNLPPNVDGIFEGLSLVVIPGMDGVVVT